MRKLFQATILLEEMQKVCVPYSGNSLFCSGKIALILIILRSHFLNFHGIKAAEDYLLNVLRNTKCCKSMEGFLAFWRFSGTIIIFAWVNTGAGRVKWMGFCRKFSGGKVENVFLNFLILSVYSVYLSVNKMNTADGVEFKWKLANF